MPMVTEWRPSVREKVTVTLIRPSSWKKDEHATMTSTNQAGGTSILSGIDKFVPFKIVVTKTWWDEETGQRVVARIDPAHKELIAEIARQGECVIEKPVKDFDPAILRFHADDIEVRPA